jgi:DNA replication ATP-dependent helicase Dna2
MAPRWREILDPVHPAVFVDLYHRNSTTRNYREADLTVDLIAELLQAGLRPGEIGVVVPYRTQGREIRNRLALAIPDATARQELVVDTVERMQGQEREVIIFSMTTSNPTFAAELAGFYFQPQRLNVTITRPRTKLIVVGSSSVLHAQPEKSVDQENLVLFRDFLQSCTLRLSPYEERS